MPPYQQSKIRRLFSELRDQVDPEFQPILYRLEQMTNASLVLAQQQLDSTEAQEIQRHMREMAV